MTSPVGATPDATTPTVSAAVAAPPAFAEREAPSHPSAASPPASTAADDLPKFRTGRAPRGPVADVQRDMILSRDSLPATTGDPFWRALEGALSNCAAPPPPAMAAGTVRAPPPAAAPQPAGLTGSC